MSATARHPSPADALRSSPGGLRSLPDTLRSPPDTLRRWQRDALDRMRGWRSGPFLLSAAPGAGKTRPALELARGELAERRAASVVVIAPTAPLTLQWARAAHGLGLELVPDADSPRPPAGFDGVAVTYARIARASRRWAAAVRSGTLVIADEAHHLGEELAWGEGFATAFAQAERWLLLSGTPFRSDATPIPGVRYDAEGLAEPDVAYTYAEAVRDGVCRPVVFVAYDGTLSWRSGEDVVESSFDTVLSTREAGRRYRTAISTELPDGLPRILREADERLRALRAGGQPDAAGLVVAADSSHARRIAKLLRDATGHPPVVVLHAEARAAARLGAFRGSGDPWIVAVNMVSEGVDIPRLRVGVYATAAKTPLVFRQIVGRFVRTLPGRPAEPSWLYIPADPILRAHATGVERELRTALRRRDPDEHEPAEQEAAEPRRSEPSAMLDFEPLAADVAPQMTLFGSAAPPPAAAARGGRILAPAAPGPPTGAEVSGAGPGENAAGSREREQDPPALPAYERRRRLRAERHRLVSELTRRDGQSHREINAWLNREVGIASVERASMGQLERSVALLERHLSRRR